MGDILNIVKNLEETIESQEKRIRLLEENCNNREYGFATRMDTKSRNEECPCDEIQADIEFLKIENDRQQEEIERHDTRLDTVENPVWFDAYRLSNLMPVRSGTPSRTPMLQEEAPSQMPWMSTLVCSQPHWMDLTNSSLK